MKTIIEGEFEIPEKIDDTRYKILYILQKYPNRRPSDFYNSSDIKSTQEDVIGKTKFHIAKKFLVDKNWIIVDKTTKASANNEGKKVTNQAVYSITPEGRNALLKYLKDKHLDYDTWCDIERIRLEEIIQPIIQFLNQFDLNFNSIFFEMVDLAYAISYESLKSTIESEERYYKSLLFLVFNHPDPKFCQYNITKEEYEKKYKIESSYLSIFLQKVVIENQFDQQFLTLQIDEKTLYFRIKSEFGAIFDNTIKSVLKHVFLHNKFISCTRRNWIEELSSFSMSQKKLYEFPLKNKDKITIHVKEVIEQITRELIDNQKKFDSLMEKSLKILIAQYCSPWIQKDTILPLSNEEASINPRLIIKDIFDTERESNITTKYREIEILIQLGFFNEAMKQIELIDPKNERYYINKAEILKKLKKNTESLQCLDNGLERYPDNDLLLLEKCNFLLFDIPNYKKVIEICEKAVKSDALNKKKEEFYMILCWAYNFLRDIHEVEKNLLLLLKLYAKSFPDDFMEKNDDYRMTSFLENTFLPLLMFPDIKEKFESILKTVNYGLELWPKRIDFFQWKIKYSLELAKYDKNIAKEFPFLYSKLNQLFIKFPKSKDLVITQLDLLFYIEPDKALNLIDEQLQKNPNDMELMMKQASFHLNLQNFDQALQIFMHAASITKNQSHLDHILSEVQLVLTEFKSKTFENFLLFLNNLININPNNVTIYVYLGQYHLEGKNLRNALETIETGLHIENNNLDLIFIKIEVLQLLNRIEEAFSLLESINYHDLEENHKVNYLLIKSNLYIASKRYLDALKCNNLALNLRETRNSYLQRLLLMEKSGKYEEGLQVIKELQDFEEQIPIFSDNFFINDCMNRKAYLLAYMDKKSQSIKSIKELIKQNPDESNFLDSFGEILMHFKDYDQAIIQFENALQMDPESDYIYETFIKAGECYFYLENHQRSLEYLKKGKKLAETREDILYTKEWIDKANRLITELEKK